MQSSEYKFSMIRLNKQELADLFVNLFHQGHYKTTQTRVTTKFLLQ